MKKIIVIILVAIISIVNAEEIKIKLLKTMEFSDLHEDLFKLNDYRFLDDKTITSFDESLCKILVLDLDNLSARYIGQKGKGPGDLQQASFFIKKGKKNFCVDYGKDAILEFDNDFNFLKETKLDFSAVSLCDLENNNFGIMKSTLFMDSEEKEDLFKLYDSSLENKGTRFNYEISQWDYDRIGSYMMYSTSSVFIHRDYNYLFFQSLPLILKINTKTNEREFINYEKQLDFLPVPPTLRKQKIGNGRGMLFIANLFVFETRKEDNSIYFSLANPKEEMSEEYTNYIYKFNFSDDSFEKINLIGENLELKDNLRIILTDSKLFIFNNDEESISIYEKK